jgi:predicted nucleotidyltransferase
MTSDGEATTTDELARISVAGLPPSIRERLEEFKRSVEAALGDNLVGILVHGNVVRGEYRAGESDVDVVVVAHEISFADLEAIGNASQLARYAARIEAMILTEREIAGASDCFPLLIDEIKRRQFVLSGRDPFAGIRVHDTHRRLRIEQELREAQIRLRRAVIDAFGAREAIGGAVARKVRQVRAPLHALLALKGIACPSDRPSVLAKVGEVYGVDVAPLRTAREAPDAAHAALVALLAKTIEDVNGMDQTPSRGGP